MSLFKVTGSLLSRRHAIMVAALTLICAQPVAAQVCDQSGTLTRPIPLGVSGGSIKSFVKVQGREECFGGTLGSLVQDAHGQYILSNNHVLARLNSAKKGEGIVEPGLVDSKCVQFKADTVASLSRFVKVTTGKKSINQVDAAIALVSPGQVSSEILNIGSISSVLASPTLGLSVMKMGRTTCFTSGTISAISVNLAINESELKPGAKNAIANFINQILVNGDAGTFGSPGDSGSLVVTNTPCPQPVGLLFAGDSRGDVLLNPIGPVTSALGVSFVGGCTASPQAAVAAPDAIGATSDALVRDAASRRDAHAADLEAIPGMIGTGIAAGDAPGEVAVELYVLHATHDVVAAAPQDIDGTPVRVVEKAPFNLY